MSETSAPPPSSSDSNKPGGIFSHATTMTRNIVVSVTSTVLGATLIYFLGFSHKDKGNGKDSLATMLITKEATIKAWKGYVTMENIYYKNVQSIVKDLQENKKLGEFRENMLREGEKFMNDVPALAKDKDIDPAFLSMVNRRIENEKLTTDKMKIYLDKLQKILDAGYGQEELQKKLEEEDNAWSSYTRGAYERTITDVEDIAKALSERYGQSFAMTDLVMFAALKKEGSEDVNKQNPENKAVTEKTDDKGAPADPGANKTDANDQGNNAVVKVDRPDPAVNPATRKNTSNALNASSLVGNWDTYNAGIDLYQNGTFYWTPDNAEETSGTWKIYNNQLYMYPNANSYIPMGTIWVFNVTGLSAKSFTMTLATTPFNQYYMTRTN